MNKNKTTRLSTSASNIKTPNARGGSSNRKFDFNASTYCNSNDGNSSAKCPNFRSKSNLTGNGNSNTDRLESNGKSQNIYINNIV